MVVGTNRGLAVCNAYFLEAEFLLQITFEDNPERTPNGSLEITPSTQLARPDDFSRVELHFASFDEYIFEF